MKLPILFALLAAVAFGQAVRIDPAFVSTTAGNVNPGAPPYAPVLAIPGAAISLCGYPAVGVPCSNFATTYTDATAGPTCPPSKPVVLSGTSSCSAFADAKGRFGFWVAPGSYAYGYTINGTYYGPYPVSAGGGGGGGGSFTFPGAGIPVSTGSSGPWLSSLAPPPAGTFAGLDIATSISAALNSKISANQVITLTGAVTGSGATSIFTSLPTVNAAPGVCGDTTHWCQVSGNAGGQITNEVPVSIAAASGTVTGATINGSATNVIGPTGGILDFQLATPQTVGFGFLGVPSGSGDSMILKYHANLAPVVFTTSGTVLAAQAAGLVICNSATPITLSLPQANFPGGNPNFIQGDPISFLNNGAGTCTVSPTGSTITNGTSTGLITYVLPAAAAGVPSSVELVSDPGGNYTVRNFSPQAWSALTFTGDTTGSGSTPIALTTVKLNGVLLSGLVTGLLKNNTGTGAPSIAAAADLPSFSRSTYVAAAGCAQGIPSSGFDLPSTLFPIPNCYGTSYAFGALDYADSANTFGYVRFVYPTGTTSIDADLYYSVPATTQATKFTIATVCIGSGADELNPTFNTAQTLSSTSSGTSNTLTIVSQAALTMTGCTAGTTEMILKVGRDTTDTSTQTLSLRGLRLTAHVSPTT